MAGLDPAIHVFAIAKKESEAWITGSSPVMTTECAERARAN
jgi:hypothetical protein